MKPAKFKIGDKVKYIPKLLPKNTVLTVRSCFWKTSDSLNEALGIQFSPTWVYSFEETSLIAIEKNLFIIKSNSNG